MGCCLRQRTDEHLVSRPVSIVSDNDGKSCAKGYDAWLLPIHAPASTATRSTNQRTLKRARCSRAHFVTRRTEESKRSSRKHLVRPSVLKTPKIFGAHSAVSRKQQRRLHKPHFRSSERCLAVHLVEPSVAWLHRQSALLRGRARRRRRVQPHPRCRGRRHPLHHRRLMHRLRPRHQVQRRPEPGPAIRQQCN